MTLLAGANASMSLAGHRRQQVWETAALRAMPKLLRNAPADEEHLVLPEAPEGKEVVWDYAATRLTLRRHPLAILRPTLSAQGWKTAVELHDLETGRPAMSCGIVTVRQQPETAHGVMFVSLEDETGSVQVIVWPKVKVRLRQPLLRARLLAVRGTWQREGDVRTLIAGYVEDLTPLLGRLAASTSMPRLSLKAGPPLRLDNFEPASWSPATPSERLCRANTFDKKRVYCHHKSIASHPQMRSPSLELWSDLRDQPHSYLTSRP